LLGFAPAATAAVTPALTLHTLEISHYSITVGSFLSGPEASERPCVGFGRLARPEC
jgi:hypothetical protein